MTMHMRISSRTLRSFLCSAILTVAAVGGWTSAASPALAQAEPAPAALTQAQAQAPAATKGRTYVLVHGAWFGGWVWKDVAASLRAVGNTVYAPSLTGLGDRRHLLRPGINLDTHTDDITNLILDENLRDVVLVGWSYGGMVISNVLARVPDRITSMVYLDAYYPEAGRSAASYIPSNDFLKSLADLAGQNQDVPALTMKDMGITTPELVRLSESRISQQPVGTFLQPSKALAERPSDVIYTFILAGRFDGILFRPTYERFQKEKIGDAFVLNTSHATMLAAPAETAELLKNVR